MAIREELGEAIDAYPGCRSPEGADPINRAFRAVARSLIRADLAHRDGPRRRSSRGPSASSPCDGWRPRAGMTIRSSP